MHGNRGHQSVRRQRCVHAADPTHLAGLLVLALKAQHLLGFFARSRFGSRFTGRILPGAIDRPSDLKDCVTVVSVAHVKIDHAFDGAVVTDGF